MPRFRPKAQIVNALRKENIKRAAAATVRHAMEDSSDDSSDDEGFIHDCVDMRLQNAEKAILSQRYLFRNNKNRNRSQFFDLEDCLSPDSKRFNDDEFRVHFRMCRKSFHSIVELIKDSKHFQNKPKKRKMATVQLHLLVFLRKMGAEGTEGNNDKIASF